MTGVDGGHEMIVTHKDGIVVYRPVCHEPRGADCRLVCREGCVEEHDVTHDDDGAFHISDGERHEMIDAGECQAVLWLEEDFALTPELDAGGIYLRRYHEVGGA